MQLDEFMSNAPTTLTQAHPDIVVERRPGIDGQRGTSNLGDAIDPERSEIPPKLSQDSGLTPRGGLPPWQVCKVLTLIETPIDAPIRCFRNYADERRNTIDLQIEHR
jgi:hypothetical protein